MPIDGASSGPIVINSNSVPSSFALPKISNVPELNVELDTSPIIKVFI